MKPVLLCILDGCGIRDSDHGNAFKLANTPNLDYLFNTYPNSLLEASSTFVGLPNGQMGNSEVGHMNIGAGRVVKQPLVRIDESISNNSFNTNEEFLNIIKHVKQNNSRLHLYGLLSDGGIHSHINHLFSLIDLCVNNNIDNVYIHIVLDGRDTYRDSGISYIHQLQNKIKNTNYKIGTVSGRYYAMDRDKRWDRVKLFYDAITKSSIEILDLETYILNSYKEGIYDEFIKPINLDSESIIKDNDAMIIFNYRPDRLKQFCSILNNENDNIPNNLNNFKFITMMYVSDNVVSAFKPLTLHNMLGEVISNNNLSQLRIAETEKYAHVTYFFDGGKELNLKRTDKILVSSPKVATYDMKPEMSAFEITEKLLNSIDKYDFIVLNFANGDMVGHTGNLEAAIESVEAMDKCINRLYEKIKKLDGTLIITADHGNCDVMIDDDEKIVTTHTTNKVPFIVTRKDIEINNGKLADIAPSILYLYGIPIPKEMDGNNLIKKM